VAGDAFDPCPIFLPSIPFANVAATVMTALEKEGGKEGTEKSYGCELPLLQLGGLAAAASKAQKKKGGGGR